MKLIECVPNFSEGRRPEVVAVISDAIAAVNGAHVLDVSADASHNRCVVTFVAPIETVADAAFAGIAEARRRFQRVREGHQEAVELLLNCLDALSPHPLDNVRRHSHTRHFVRKEFCVTV